jgi:hypothetical protein
MILTELLCFIFVLAIMITSAIHHTSEPVGVAAIVFSCLLPMLLGLTWLAMRAGWLARVVLVLLLAIKMVYEWMNRADQFVPILSLMFNCYLTINFRAKLWLVLLTVLVSTASSVVWEALTYISKNASTPLMLKSSYYYSMYSTVIICVYLIMCSALLLYFDYEQVKNEKVDYLTQQKIEKETQHTHEILGMLVPKFVQKGMSAKSAVQKPEQKVSILFCYVCNFDTIIKE